MVERRIDKKSAVRSALIGEPTGILFEVVQRRVESTLQQVVGRVKLYVLLGMMKTDREIKTTGRAENRAYKLTAKGRGIHVRRGH